MIIVSGHLLVAPGRREDYLAGCRTVVELARAAPGCLDFALSPDLVDADRINVLERWTSAEAVAAFRGSGPPPEQQSALRGASVVEYDVTGSRTLTGAEPDPSDDAP